MSGQYFDAVLDENMTPIYNGTPEATADWLRAHPEENDKTVCMGKMMRLVSVEEYLNAI